MQNTVKCYSYDEINKDLLKEFSEGSEALESLLNYCYENKIETRACCIGHKERGVHSKPYICFIIPQEQEYIIENIINNLFSKGEFSNYVEVEVDKENNNYNVVFRFNYLEDELRDAFFNLIQKIISYVIVNGMNEPGIYEGLFDAYRQINTDSNIILKINNSGINVYEQRDAYFKFVGNDMVEVSKENAEFLCGVLDNKYFIKLEEISDFISSKKVKKDVTI